MKFTILVLTFLFIPLNINYATSFIKYTQNPILFNNPSPSWDYNRAYLSSVILNNGNFIQFYTGFNGSRFQIGQSTSNDGLNWIKDLNNPILSKISINKDTHDPTLLFDKINYKMWYVVSENGGSTNFSIYRAISSDGKGWVDDPPNYVFNPSTGWGSKDLSTPFVLFKDETYYMFFASPDTGHWSIGYTTSTDGGVTWTPNPTNPIITQTQTWESPEISSPSVIWDGTTYHMWYSSNNYGNNSRINYATSTDLQTWDKPADKNPVLIPGPEPFDALGVGDPSVIKTESGTHLLYYSARGIINGTSAYRIALATDGPLPTPFPDVTTTPTITPTTIPTATPTPTPIPTSTPIPITKVVVIPGMGASWSSDILTCDIGTSGNWNATPKYSDIYQPLITQIQKNGMTALPYYYDWRIQIPYQTSGLKDFINAHTLPNEKVYIVGHSMGGLQARAYIEAQGLEHKVSKLITVGSPHRGSAEVYPLAEAGEIWWENHRMKQFIAFVVKWCGSLYGLSDQKVIQTLIPSVYNILPIDDYLKNQKTGQIIPEHTLTLRNNWLNQSSFIWPFYNVITGTLSGKNIKTVQNIVVKTPTKKDKATGDWVDGKPTDKIFSMEGDGTVLAASAILPLAQNFQIPENHAGLINSPSGIQTIFQFLNINRSLELEKKPLVEAKTTIIIAAYPANFSLTDGQEQTIHDTDGIIVLDNPKKGTYSFTMNPKTNTKTRIAVIQFLENGNMLWKEYTHNGSKTKKSTLRLDPANPHDDILQ